jgi:nucleoside-diphosphate-sugar epimerase
MSEAILVTGAGGFIGVPLVEALQSAGHLVHTHTSAAGDISRCRLELEGVTHVFHLAGKSFVPDSWNSTFRFYEVNVLGTVNVLEFCRHRQASMTFVSSYVYGNPDSLPIAEEHPARPFNPYSHTKLMAEEAVAYYRSQFGVPATIVRPFNIYGPGQEQRFLIPTLIRKALDPKTDEIVVSDLRPRRDYIHIRDLVTLLAATTRRLEGGVFNAGSGRSVSIEELVETITSLTGRRKPVRSLAQERPTEVLDVVADISKARAALHWTPSVGLRDGLRDTIDWMERVGAFQ